MKKTKQTCLFLTISVVAAAQAFLPPIASAQQTYQWDGGTGNYDNPDRWIPTGVPTAVDNAFQFGGGTISVPGTVSGSASTLISGNGLISVTGGSLSAASTLIGFLDGVTGTVTVSAGTFSSTDLNIGNTSLSGTGTGTLNVSGGAVSGSNYIVGSSGSGNQGNLNVSSGSLTVTNNLDVGSNATGILSQTGGSSSVANFRLGTGTGTGTATVSAGTLTATSSITVGFTSANNILDVTGGTVTSAGNAIIGSVSGSSGTVSVSDGEFNTNAIFVGNVGDGTLNVTETGSVTAPGGIAIALNAASTGIINIGTGGAAGTLVAGAGIDFVASTSTSAINFNHTGSITFGNRIGGPGALNHIAGTTTLTATNSGYTGPTTITGGTLIEDGIAGSSAFGVEGGTLAGSGTTGSVTVASGGTLAPGANGENLTTNGNLDMGGTFALTINTGVTNSMVTVGGAVQLGGTLQLTLNATPVGGTNFFLIDNDGVDAISGLISGLGQGGLFSQGGQQFQISYDGDIATNSFSTAGGNDLVVQAVPEPTTTLILVSGAAFLLTRRRRA